MKKFSTIIIIKILLIIFMIQVIYVPVSEANNWGEIINSGEDFIEEGKKNVTIDSFKLKLLISQIYNTLFALGIVLSVIVGAIIGIKLMFAGIEEKAKIKEMIPPYVAGCVVVFGAFGIWKLVVTVLAKI